eukprot:CAMPEP_0179865588 /NCGR_PEP_ID=MMETSP0982-20121206/16928_1 /TAXON_ID=483367 /ORGANISM="non described non described, Strain CCMP 2436" /LENGTH=298 /DNA_ID=CAMNT_0021754313 /DNA_START=63 /DNA_END=960 /DNA_ORIENTATION=-
MIIIAQGGCTGSVCAAPMPPRTCAAMGSARRASAAHGARACASAEIRPRAAAPAGARASRARRTGSRAGRGWRRGWPPRADARLPAIGQRRVEGGREVLTRARWVRVEELPVVNAVVGEQQQRQALAVCALELAQVRREVRVERGRADARGLVALEQHPPRERRQAGRGVMRVEGPRVRQQRRVRRPVAEAAGDGAEVELVGVVSVGAPGGEQGVVRRRAARAERVCLLHHAPVAHVRGEGGRVPTVGEALKHPALARPVHRGQVPPVIVARVEARVCLAVPVRGVLAAGKAGKQRQL